MPSIPELVARHDAAGRESARIARADLAAQLAPALAAAPAETIGKAVERCPSLRRYPVGMSPKVRTAVRARDISHFDFDRQLAIAASLGKRLRIVLEDV